MERLVDIVIEVEVNTNKETYTRLLTMGEEETVLEFSERVAKAIRDLATL